MKDGSQVSGFQVHVSFLQVLVTYNCLQPITVFPETSFSLDPPKHENVFGRRCDLEQAHDQLNVVLNQWLDFLCDGFPTLVWLAFHLQLSLRHVMVSMFAGQLISSLAHAHFAPFPSLHLHL